MSNQQDTSREASLIENLQMLADNLIWPIWRGLSEDYKEKYKADAWEHLEHNIRSAAYTTSLSEFLSKIKRRLPVEIQQKHLDDVIKTVSRDDQEEILKMIRDHSTMLMLQTRKINESRKEKFK